MGIYHVGFLCDGYSDTSLDHTMKSLLSRRLKFVVPDLRVSDWNFLFTSCQAFIRSIDELIKWHADLTSVLEIGLVLFVVELGCWAILASKHLS